MTSPLFPRRWHCQDLPLGTQQLPQTALGSPGAAPSPLSPGIQEQGGCSTFHPAPAPPWLPSKHILLSGGVPHVFREPKVGQLCCFPSEGGPWMGGLLHCKRREKWEQTLFLRVVAQKMIMLPQFPTNHLISRYPSVTTIFKTIRTYFSLNFF